MQKINLTHLKCESAVKATFFIKIIAIKCGYKNTIAMFKVDLFTRFLLVLSEFKKVLLSVPVVTYILTIHSVS